MKKTVTVKVGAFPGGQIRNYTLQEGSTYGDALHEANLAGTDSKSLDVRVNGTRVSDLLAKVANNDQILVFSKVRGN